MTKREENSQSRRSFGWAMILLCLAFALRAVQLDGPRFHPDEALFASFARSIAVWRDPLLQAAPVDKPPLLYYLQAFCYPFLGPREMAARIPNLYASLITIALTFALARRLSAGSRLAALLSAILVTLSPLSVAFGPTAFTDPLLVMWCMASLVAAASNRPGWAGFWLGLALATKYQALLFVPAVLGLIMLTAENRNAAWPLRLLAASAGPLIVVAAWEWARGGGISMLAAQIAGYGGLTVTSPRDWIPRLFQWFVVGEHMLGSSILLGLLILTALSVLLIARPPIRELFPGILMSAWLVGYCLVHWLLSVQIWDRYLLPVVPPLAVTVAWWINRACSGAPQVLQRLILAAALCLPSSQALRASAGELPVGGDHGLYDGIEQVAAFLDPSPYGTVLYDHWLSWHLRYYLFDSRVYVSWYPDDEALVRDLMVFGADPPRFLIAPSWEPHASTLGVVESAGYQVNPVLHTHRPDGTLSFTVYGISPSHE